MAARRKTLLTLVRSLFGPKAEPPQYQVDSVERPRVLPPVGADASVSDIPPPWPTRQGDPFAALFDEDAPVGPDPSARDKTPPRPATQHVVDNGVFLRGLDHLYREAMRRHEGGELLQCAQRVAARLDVQPLTVPVEGYYSESKKLTEYFLLMRALQAVDQSRVQAVKALPEFRRLEEVASSPIYGKPAPSDRLLPAARDPLSQAMHDTAVTRWSAQSLTAAAHANAVQTDDISLVGLAARTQDPVLVAAVRESVVLYAEQPLGAMNWPEYVWAVDDALARQAGRFVAAFNSLFDERLPMPEAAHAARFWTACADDEIAGRCVCLGSDDSSTPARHYHWAIYHDRSRKSLAVQEFWRPEVWTTARYRGRRYQVDGHRIL